MQYMKVSVNPLVHLLILLSLLCTPAVADELVVEEMSRLDRQYLERQRSTIDDIAAFNFGTRFSGDKDRDVALLQRILDEGLVENDQTRQLQAMGVILGDLLAADLDMDWVIYKDELGRSHALRYRQTDNYLFPVTMISRRREVDNTTPVAEIYRKAEEAMREAIPSLPFSGP